ncbi:MAG: ATP-binding protein [Deltaproteobacteria bacterium]|nr:ATP-binding protein [Deltaproteobacteria bacterium]
MALAHLICGSTGAGKTTYALKLAERQQAVRFTLDDWMKNLFWMDCPEPLEYEWALERVKRCEERILSVCSEMAGMDVEIVLDFGFFEKAQRERVMQALDDMGIASRLHYLPVQAGERWKRVDMRNRLRGGTFFLEVSRGMFDFCENLFEEPDKSELRGAVIVDGEAGLV